MKYKLVIFDLDNTLVKTRPAAKAAYREAIFFLAQRHNQAHLQTKLYNHWKRLVQSLMSEILPHKRRFRYSLTLLLQAHNLPQTYLNQTLQVYEKALLSNLQPIPGAKELLSSLKAKGLTITVATGSDRQEAIKKLKRANLFPYLDLLVTANDVNLMKPSPKYYQTILDTFSVSPAKTLVVGDSLAEDIAPAKTLKLDYILLASPQVHLMSLLAKIT